MILISFLLAPALSSDFRIGGRIMCVGVTLVTSSTAIAIVLPLGDNSSILCPCIGFFRAFSISRVGFREGDISEGFTIFVTLLSSSSKLILRSPYGISKCIALHFNEDK